MNRMTITEALSELHVIDKRLETKRQFVAMNCMLDSRVKDPLGDTKAEVAAAHQSIEDLEERRVIIRIKIAEANAATEVNVDGMTKSIAEWLHWKREIGPARLEWLKRIKANMDRAHKELLTQLTRELPEGAPKPGLDNMVDPGWLTKSIDKLETRTQRLDGQLSLKNATTFIEA